MRATLYASVACFVLSACSAIVPSTAARLAALDPLTADPAGIELLVILPPGLAVKPGSAKLESARSVAAKAARAASRLPTGP